MAERAKNEGRSLSSTMTALVEQQPLKEGEERIHSVLFPNKMSHEQALTIDKFGDGLKYVSIIYIFFCFFIVTVNHTWVVT